MFRDVLEYTGLPSYLLSEYKNESLTKVILMIFYLFHSNTSNYRISASANNNKRPNVGRGAVSQISLVNTCIAVNEEIKRFQNFDVTSKINPYRMIMY